MQSGNLFAAIPDVLPTEQFDCLLQTEHLRLERIVSKCHATPLGEWYDQERPEWVVLLRGGAGLIIEGQEDVVVLKPGDYLLIPAHVRHRVEWTEEETVWLALHYAV